MRRLVRLPSLLRCSCSPQLRQHRALRIPCPRLQLRVRSILPSPCEAPPRPPHRSSPSAAASSDCPLACFAEVDGDDENQESYKVSWVKEEFANDASSPTVDSAAQPNGLAGSDSNADNPKDETPNAELLNSSDTVQNNDGDATAANDVQENVEVVDVASGSPLPGMKQQLDESVRILKATIDILKDQVFGFDAFFVTNQEPYELRCCFIWGLHCCSVF